MLPRETHGVIPILASLALVPVEAAEDVEPAFLPAVQVQAQDGGEDKQHHGEVEYHNHRSLQARGDMSERGLAIPSCPPPERDPGPTWREKARRAGMGTRAAMKKAIMLLTEVRATLVPVRFRHSPIRSCRDRGRG